MPACHQTTDDDPPDDHPTVNEMAFQLMLDTTDVSMGLRFFDPGGPDCERGRTPRGSYQGVMFEVHDDIERAIAPEVNR